MTALLAKMTPEEILTRSEGVSRNFLGTREVQESDCIMVFLSMPGEVRTELMVEAALTDGRMVVAPVVAQ